MTNNKYLRDKDLASVIQILTSSAFYADDASIINHYLDYLGLGKIIYSKKVRDGIKAIIDLCEENRSLKNNEEYLKDLLENYEAINNEIIDQDNFELLTNKEKVQIKKYIDNILSDKE